jgi:hypothetical protein
MDRDMKASKVYGVLISTGGRKARALVGWDAPCASRDEARALADKAGAHAGWTARVVEMNLAEAREHGWVDACTAATGAGV